MLLRLRFKSNAKRVLIKIQIKYFKFYHANSKIEEYILKSRINSRKTKKNIKQCDFSFNFIYIFKKNIFIYKKCLTMELSNIKMNKALVLQLNR